MGVAEHYEIRLLRTQEFTHGLRGILHIHDVMDQNCFPGEFFHTCFRQGDSVIGVAQHGVNRRDGFQLCDHIHRPHIARVQNAIHPCQCRMHRIGHLPVRV